MKRLLRWAPGAATLVSYQRSWLVADVLSGVVLAAVVIPASMACAQLAGLTPIAGLYASLVALVAYTVFGPSRAIVMGPDSATAPLVAAVIVPMAMSDPAARATLAATLALMVGLISLTVSLSRLGFVTDLISKPVRIGYMNGLAVVIVVGQLPALFGFSAGGENVFQALLAFWRGLASTNPIALALGASTLAVILVLRWLTPKAPGPLIAVLGATVVSTLLDVAEKGVATVGQLPSGLPSFQIPAMPLSQMLALATGALGIAVITLTDTVVLSRSFASRFGYHSHPDEEFLALGAANLAAGLFQGLPVSGSQSRSSINVSAGAKSQLSGVVAALVLGLMLVAAPGLLHALPMSVLAAVIIVAGLSLADVGGTARLLYLRRTEFIVSIATFLGVIMLGVLPGVLLAVVLSILNIVRRQWWPHDAVLARMPGVKGYHDTSEFPDAQEVPGLLIYRFDAPLFFANAAILRHRLLERIEAHEPPVQRVIIAAEPLIDVDTTATDVLADLIRELHSSGIEVGFAEIKHMVRERLERAGVIELVGAENLYPTIGSAVHAYVRQHGVDWVDWEDGS